MTQSKKNAYWGEASAVDKEGKERGISIYRDGTSFRLVDDKLRQHVAHPSYKLDRESIRREIRNVFNYRDIEFSFPQYGVDLRKRN
jgi:hypothetical protein